MVMKNNPSKFSDGPESIEIGINGQRVRMQPNHPVEQVSWKDVQVFIEKLNRLSKADDPLIYKIILDHSRGKVYRLPAEAEWEYAARAGTDTQYSFGDDGTQLKDYGWFSGNSKKQTHAVGLKRPNPWGLYDVHGNVGEWIEDQSVSSHVFRGGSWSYNEQGACVLLRYFRGPDFGYDDIGFRLVSDK